jgi:CRISPR/Cas system CSM-associated protein Csm5 (group 7 of RAMP superfamily)
LIHIANDNEYNKNDYYLQSDNYVFEDENNLYYATFEKNLSCNHIDENNYACKKIKIDNKYYY